MNLTRVRLIRVNFYNLLVGIMFGLFFRIFLDIIIK